MLCKQTCIWFPGNKVCSCALNAICAHYAPTHALKSILTDLYKILIMNNMKLLRMEVFVTCLQTSSSILMCSMWTWAVFFFFFNCIWVGILSLFEILLYKNIINILCKYFLHCETCLIGLIETLIDKRATVLGRQFDIDNEQNIQWLISHPIFL